MIREAISEDFKAVLKIYNAGIMTGTASFEVQPLSIEDGEKWFESFKKEYPMLVLEENKKILGYVTISPYGHQRELAYHCGELSIYIDEKAQGMGVGSRLMDKVIEKVKQEGKLKTIISVITEGNEASVRLHEKKGFIYSGRLVNVATKHNKALNILFYQKLLNEKEI